MEVTPRVNSAKAAEHVGRVVRLIGKITRLDGDVGHLEASDLGQIQVKLNHDSHWESPGHYVEVVGKVTEENQIQEYTSVNLGSDIDMKLVEEVVQATAKFPDIFPASA